MRKRTRPSRVDVSSLSTMGQEWLSYCEHVYPDGMGEEQRHQLRLAFMAGGVAMRSMLNRLGGSDISIDEGVAALQKVDRELNAFKELAKDRQV